jgi:hypothetical protein
MKCSGDRDFVVSPVAWAAHRMDVAHELRTPVSVIQANLEAMQDGILPTDAE